MRKLFFSILALTLLVFVGCAKESEHQATPSPTPEATSNTTVEPTDTPAPTEEATPAETATPLPTVEPGTNQYAGEIDETKAIKADFYEGGHVGQQAHKIFGSFSVQFFATTTFNKVGISMPTWFQEEGHAATLSLYAWQGSYEATMMSEPVVTKEVADWKDGVEVLIELDEELPDGEYLYEIYNEDTDNVCVWYKAGTVDYVRSYYNNEIWEAGTPRLVVYYTKKPSNIHGPIQASGLE
ncbi:MAG TPA: hypothetical protein PLI11_02130 [Clostridia bacterium]|nr:hypothetical protein [Clostridia bacterium]HPZ51693.1 hypothetical protein [Clostridia bacterium]